MYKKFLLFGFAFLLLHFTNSSFAQQDDKLVILHTPSGKMIIEFFPNDAPNHVDNFIQLTENGFYDGVLFHRVIPGFMIQGGDPKTKSDFRAPQTEWGTGGPERFLDAEFNTIKHNRGIVSMARTTDPNSAGSQFFIVHKDSNFLDGQYTVFGRLTTQESYNTLDKIALLETTPNDIPLQWEQTEILRTELVDSSEVPDLLNQGDPVRMITSINPSENQEYKNEKLGVSFSAPPGWTLQEPQKTHPEVPDIVAVGTQTAGIYPVISITIYFTDEKSLEQRVAEIRETLQPSIESGQLTIISEEKTTINGNEAFITDAVGIFENENSNTNIKFQEIIIRTNEKFYVITYTNAEENFDSNLENFEETLNSFKILSKSTSSLEKTPENNPDEGGGCLIATATYGTELAPQIQQLRELRDNFLLQTQSGTNFMAIFNQFYYSFSPTIADLERQSPIFKEVVKLALTPLISSLSILNYVDIDSEDKVLSYGISLILLNIGMYFALPAIIIYRIKK